MVDLTIKAPIPAYAVSCAKSNTVIKFDDCLYVKVNPKCVSEAWYTKLMSQVDSTAK